MTDADLEQRIRRAERHYRESAEAGHTYFARCAWLELVALIKERSAEQVKKMEVERGLT